ncbi:MAG: DUF4178 domain-containing protein [Planctomycetes bacterium]|nr:DUF4178 domain-containing protein [Planctomycetota bacterium]
MFCPSCGGEIEADRRFAQLVVCKYCESAVVLDEKAARVAGKMAVLAQTPSPLYVGGTGELLERRFTILGRVRYAYTRGFWDEWYLGFEDGTRAWISEDENNFTLETAEETATLPTDYATAQPGSLIPLGETILHVDEKDIAECEGGEGQLPFTILSGEKVPFLDLSTGEHFATIEFDIDGGAKVFRGRRLNIADVKLDMTAEEAGVLPPIGLAPEREAGEGRRERIVRRDERAKDLKCFGCGAPLEIPEAGRDSLTCQYCGAAIDLTVQHVPCGGCGASLPLHGGDEVKSVVCTFCHTQLDLSRRGEPAVLGTLADKARPKVPIKLGQKFRWQEQQYVVVGHIRWEERDGYERYFSDEYLLYSKETGYRWLIHEDRHWSFSAELDERPTTIDPRIAIQKQKFRFLARQWTVYESNLDATRVIWVNGELPWVAHVGDRVSYMDAISPPHMLSAEWSQTEMEWYLAEYLPHQQVLAALGKEPQDISTPTSIAPHQPYNASAFRQQSKWVMALFTVLFACFALLAFGQKGNRVGSFTVNAQDYTEEFLTNEFTVTEPHTLCQARFYAPVDNSWVYLDVALVNAESEALLDFSAQMSYYHGREGGESWSEGSPRDAQVFKVKEPGSYRLLLLGQAGTGEQAGSTVSAGRQVGIDVYQGVGLARYHLVLACLCLTWVFVECIRRWTFEARRWAPVIEDDDDD